MAAKVLTRRDGTPRKIVRPKKAHKKEAFLCTGKKCRHCGGLLSREVSTKMVNMMSGDRRGDVIDALTKAFAESKPLDVRGTIANTEKRIHKLKR